VRVPQIEPAHRIDYRKSRARSAFGVIVVRFRPAEISHHTVPEVFRHKAVEMCDCFRHCAEIVSFDFTPFLGVEACRNLG
jgi:hypothetical protein